MTTESFDERVWDIARKIPQGRVSTYKQIAQRLRTKAYRAVGNALKRNPHWPTVPCHRVVKSNGSVGGFASGTRKKTTLLKREGVEVRNNKIVNFKNRLFRL